ncbi:hypothetical protein FRC09_003599 [Ceratobasidium sp. 395]|nr:hypothetical protein FRC09_003599 [Ceratobasidium sp. 395]
MAGKKTGSRAKKSKNNTESTSAAGSAKKYNVPDPHNGHDYSWLEEDTLPRVDDPELHRKSLIVLKVLEEQNLDYGRFNWGLNWGNDASRNVPEMQRARGSFRGEYLVPTLHNVRFPPRTLAKGPRPPNAQGELDAFALSLVGHRLRDELRAFEKGYSNLKPENFTSEEGFKSVSYEDIQDKVLTLCPVLFALLYMLVTCIFRRGRWESNGKDSDFFIVIMIACMAFNLSSANNAMQRLLGYYFYAKHVPKAVITLLSEINICMSYPSIIDTLSTINKAVRKAMREAVEKFPVLFVHDNIRIKQAVRSQRHNNQTVTDSGTAMSVLVLPESARPAWEDPEAVRALRQHVENQRVLGNPLRITFSDLNCPIRQARVLSHKLFHLLDILRAIPGCKNLDILSSPILQRPPGEHELKFGPDYRTRQYMLETRPIDESLYSGNLMVIQDFLRQVALDSGNSLIRLTLERLIPWVGDELTIARLRALQWQRQEECNGYDRLDPFIFIFGWFHALLCLVTSIFENHRGSAAGLGFAHSVLALGRTGFSENMRQHRPDYHTVKEFLMHEFEARIRGLWLWITGTTTLDELKTWIETPGRTPEEILEAAKRIQLERVSKQAVSLYNIEMEEAEDTDPVFLNTLIQLRDLEMFWDLRHAIKHGLVGHMEDLIPDLLVFFTGGRNANYARQMYEILLLLYHESTPAIRYSIREHCWLVNMKGQKNSFYPVDQRQELNNKGIRDYGPPPQGKTSWEDYEKASPLIPLHADVVEHVEDMVHKVQRSHIHKDPSWEKELEILLKDHAETQLLTPVLGRNFATKSDRGKDYFKLGTVALQDKDGLAKYEARRAPFFRSRETENDLSDCLHPLPQPPSERLGTP